MGSRRLPTRLTRRAKARARFGWARSERATVALAAVALAGVGAVLAGQYGRMLQRRAHQSGGDGLVEAAPVAARDTVGVAVSGYADAPRSETVLFNLLAGFLGSFALVRLSTWGIRDGWWPFRNVSLGATAILSIAILTLRMLRRGERRQEQEGLIPPAHHHQLSFGTAA